MKNQLSKLKNRIFRGQTKWLIAALVTFLSVLVATISYAETPEYAQIVQLSGDRLQFQLGSQRPEPARVGLQLRNNSQALIIPGNNSSWSTLAFITPQPKDSARMTVAAGPDTRDTVFRFPCQSEGGLILVSWEQGSDRGCEAEGFRVGRRRNRNAQLPSSNNNITAQRNKSFLAQVSDSDDVTVKPDSSQEKFFEGVDTGNSVNIIAIRGNFTVISQQFPQGRTLQQGQLYIYLGNGQGRIEPIDLRPVINSRPVQNFLNPNNWSSPDLPQRVANSIGSQVNNLQTALGLPQQPVASSPGDTRPTTLLAATEFPLYEIVGVSTTSNVQPLTFSPNGSLTLASAKSLPNQVIKRSLARIFPLKLTLERVFHYPAATQPESNHQITQFPGINLPIPGGARDVIQDAALSQIAGKLGGVLGAESPTIANFKDAYPTVSQPPGGTFTPSNASLQEFYKSLKSGGLTVSLSPGDYSIPVHVFCMKHSAHAPGSSETFLLAPLKGKQAKAIAALNSRFVATGINRDTIQSLSWAIQAGTKYEELSAQQRAIVDRLIPEFKSQLSQTFWEKIESTWGQVSSTVPGAPSLDSVIGKMGPTGELLRTYQQARAAVQQHGDNYSALSRALLLPGQASGGADSRYPRGIWSKVSDRIYARLLPTGLGSPGTLDIRVLATN